MRVTAVLAGGATAAALATTVMAVANAQTTATPTATTTAGEVSTTRVPGVSAADIGPAGTLGTLTMTPATGSDLTAPQVRTSAGCAADSDAYNVFVFGPGTFAAGYLITSTADAGFSTTAPFDIFFGVSMKDAATDLGTTLVAGEYPVVAQCVDSFLGDVKGTFTISMTFTSPTSYVTTPTTTSPTSSTTTTSGTTTTATTTTTTTAPTSTNGPGTNIGVTIPTTTPPPGSGLPNTGGPVRDLLIAALLLLGAGATLVSVAGHRPQRPGQDTR